MMPASAAPRTFGRVEDAGLSRFRAELHEWFGANAIPELRNLAEQDPDAVKGLFQGVWTGKSTVLRDAFLEWDRRCSAVGLVCPQWPETVGGSGFTVLQQVALAEELAASGMPRATRGIGEWLVGPVLIHYGTDAQRSYFLPKIVSAEHIYCQGFSEPDAGSDLAGVRTTGTVDGDQIEIDGHKVWTSQGDLSNMIFVLARTDPTSTRHNGLSFVLVPMEENGVTLRPIRQMSGRSGFTEEFLDGARAPMFNVIGGLGNGWKAAMTALGAERGASVSVEHLRYEGELNDLLEAARTSGRSTDPLLRQELAKAYSMVSIMRFAGQRALAAMVASGDPGVWADVTKLYTTEYHKWFGDLVLRTLGMDGLTRPVGERYPVSPWQEIFFWSRAGTIYAGSSEVQRNIIGERILGLPKEPPPR